MAGKLEQWLSSSSSSVDAPLQKAEAAALNKLAKSRPKDWNKENVENNSTDLPVRNKVSSPAKATRVPSNTFKALASSSRRHSWVWTLLQLMILQQHPTQEVGVLLSLMSHFLVRDESSSLLALDCWIFLCFLHQSSDGRMRRGIPKQLNTGQRRKVCDSDALFKNLLLSPSLCALTMVSKCIMGCVWICTGIT